MAAPESQLFLVRMSGTISTKAPPTRKHFQRELEENLRAALETTDGRYSVDRRWNRIFVRATSDRAADRLLEVPGVQSIRPATRRNWTSLEDIVDAGRDLFGDRVSGETFAVRARRVGHREPFPFASEDVKEELGRALVDCGGEVDLDDPEIEVRLEVHHEQFFFYRCDLPGPGGLPVGVEGRALALVSGGFDSAVAAWTMLKRGVALDFVFFNLGGPPHEEGARRVVGTLADRWTHGTRPELHIVDFRPLLAELRTQIDGTYWQVVLKRLMFRAAGRVADAEGHSGLVSGESIGQVSSQTLGNLAAIDDAVDHLVLRPLSGYNKEDVIDLARRIGIHDVAEHTPEFCALQGPRPATCADAASLDASESELDLSLLDSMVEGARTVDLRSRDDADPIADVRVEEIPEDAAVIDLRSERAYQRWHVPDALHVPFDTALDQHALLPPSPTYLLYCDVGLKSALIAEKMQKAGFDAYSFDGGVTELRERTGDSERTAVD